MYIETNPVLKLYTRVSQYYFVCPALHFYLYKFCEDKRKVWSGLDQSYCGLVRNK